MRMLLWALGCAVVALFFAQTTESKLIWWIGVWGYLLAATLWRVAHFILSNAEIVSRRPDPKAEWKDQS